MDLLRELPDDALGHALAHVLTGSFPSTPDIASVVRARLERDALAYPELGPHVAPPTPQPGPSPSRRRIRRVTALAILVLILLAAIIAAIVVGHLGLMPAIAAY